MVNEKEFLKLNCQDKLDCYALCSLIVWGCLYWIPIDFSLRGYILPIFEFFLVIVTGLNKGKFQITKFTLWVVLLNCCVMLCIAIGNYAGKDDIVFLFSMITCLLCMFVIQPSSMDEMSACCNFAKKTFKIFAGFLAVYTIFFKTNIELYIQMILPYMQADIRERALDTVFSGYGIPVGGEHGYVANVLVFCAIIIFVQLRCSDDVPFNEKVLFLMIVFAVLIYGRRSELLCFLLSLFVVIMATLRRNICRGECLNGSKHGIQNMLIILSLAVVLFVAYDYGFLDRYFNVYEHVQEGVDFTSGRDILWQIAFDGFVDNPFGHGWKSFGQYMLNNLLWRNYNGNVHNLVLQLLYEIGLVGAFVVLLLLVIVYVNTGRLVLFFKGKCYDDYMFEYHLTVVSLGCQTFLLMINLMDVNFYRVHFWIFYTIAVIFANMSYLTYLRIKERKII